MKALIRGVLLIVFWMLCVSLCLVLIGCAYFVLSTVTYMFGINLPGGVG